MRLLEKLNFHSKTKSLLIYKLEPQFPFLQRNVQTLGLISQMFLMILNFFVMTVYLVIDQIQKICLLRTHTFPPFIRKSGRVRVTPSWHKDFVVSKTGKFTSPHKINTVINYDRCSPAHKLFAVQISSIKEPSSFVQPSKDQRWIEAMRREIDALEVNQTWVITYLPVDKTVFDCKWVYKVKYHSDCTMTGSWLALWQKVSLKLRVWIFMILLHLSLK